MLSDDTHCTMLVDQIRDKIAHILEGFKLFVQLFSAIVAGTVTLRLQFGEAESGKFALAADFLVFLVALVTIVIILDNIRSWIALRRRLSEVAGVRSDGAPIIEPPRVWTSFRIQGLMLLIVALTTAGFWIFNPLR